MFISNVLKDFTIYDWFMSPRLSTRHTSNMSKSLVVAKMWLENHTTWKIGNGLQIRIGVVLWMGNYGPFELSEELRLKLKEIGVEVLEDYGLVGGNEGGIQNWILIEVLELDRSLVIEWNNSFRNMIRDCISSYKDDDSIVWS